MSGVTCQPAEHCSLFHVVTLSVVVSKTETISVTVKLVEQLPGLQADVRAVGAEPGKLVADGLSGDAAHVVVVVVFADVFVDVTSCIAVINVHTCPSFYPTLDQWMVQDVLQVSVSPSVTPVTVALASIAITTITQNSCNRSMNIYIY